MVHNYRPFIFWCQKVLPLVYDDSLSYYEVLCKLVHYLNQLMENMKLMGEDIEALQKQVNELEEYVKNYFATADFQNLVKNALDEMAESGTLEELLVSLIDKNVPISANGRIINAIWETTKTYLDRTDLAYMHLVHRKNVPDPDNPGHEKQVVDWEREAEEPEYGENAMNYNYGPYYGVADEKLDGSQFTGWAINCSGFAQLVLLGVPFRGSMYNTENGKHNKIGMAGYEYNMWNDKITADNYDLYYRARDMARRMRALGCGFYANPNYSNIAPGDVIFFGGQGDADMDETPTGISHVAIVLAKTEGEYIEGDDTTGLFMVVECMNQEQPIRTRTLTSYELVKRKVRYIGRPAYIGNPKDYTYKIADLNGINDTIRIDFDDDHTLYMNQYPCTLEVEFVPTSVNDYIRMSCNGHPVPYYISEFTKPNAQELNTLIKRYLPVRLNTSGGQGAGRTPIDYITITNPGGSNDIIKSATLYYGIYDGPTNNACITSTGVRDLLNKLQGKYGVPPNNSITSGRCTVTIESNSYYLGLHHFTTGTVWDCEYDGGNGYMWYRLKRGRYEALIMRTGPEENDFFTWCNYPYEGSFEELSDSLPRYGNMFNVHITITDEGYEGVYDAIVLQNDIICFGSTNLQYRRSSETIREL